MGSDKIFMFDNPAAGESAGIMSMIPALLQNKGLDPNMVAALMSNLIDPNILTCYITVS